MQVAVEETEEDVFKNYLSRYDTPTNNLSTDFERELCDFRSLRLDYEDNVLQFWECKKVEMPRLYTISQIVHGIPMTQVSVERLFSSMKYILSDQRANMANDLLESILLIRCNSFFKKNDKKRK